MINSSRPQRSLIVLIGGGFLLAVLGASALLGIAALLGLRPAPKESAQKAQAAGEPYSCETVARILTEPIARAVHASTAMPLRCPVVAVEKALLGAVTLELGPRNRLVHADMHASQLEAARGVHPGSTVNLDCFSGEDTERALSLTGCVFHSGTAP